ncbi:MAG: tRNA (cytidine-2'-O-)-methyltransferase TrmJ [Sulfolobaceae archaeon]|nr:RNA methyltransferase [Sulfolobales archaeon]MCQ4406555.1 RNA methyltransferase [Sulfolobales archaeon]
MVLVEPEGEYNVGFIARLSKNFQVDELVIVRPKADLSKAKEFSAKGSDFLERARVTDSYDEALEGVDLKIATSSIADSKGDILRKSITPWEAAELTMSKRVALVFGRESVGLTREEIAKTDFLLHIPANPEYPVLNLSHAVGIVLYEFWKYRNFVKKERNVTPEAIRLLDKYSYDIYNLLRKTEEDLAIYLALKRVLIKGVSDEEEARTVIRTLRKIVVLLSMWKAKSSSVSEASDL